MKKLVRQVSGVDVAQKELVVCIGRMYDDLVPELYSHKVFANTAKGFLALQIWIKKVTDPSIPVRYVMEATGVYHEKFAYDLKDQGKDVSIVLPNKISNYARTLTIKTVTDKTASEAITRFGLERALENWEKPLPVYKKLKQLGRERDQIMAERTMVKNQLHAELTEAEPHKPSISRANKRIEMLSKQEKEIQAEIAAMVNSDEALGKEVELLRSLPGIGLLTAATVLGETNGFELIRNKAQLTSYAGLDVKEKLSGTSVKGKPCISKKGNTYLRKAVHMPALGAIRKDERFKGLFTRLVGKHGIKMKGVVAVQRKLLEMMYTIHKSKVPYDENYLKNQAEKLEGGLKTAA